MYLRDLCLWHVGGGVEVGGAFVGVSLGRERRGVRARIVLRLLTHCTINYNIRTQLARHRALWGSHHTRLCYSALICTGVRYWRPLRCSAVSESAPCDLKQNSITWNIQNEQYADNSHASSCIAKRKDTNNFTRRTQQTIDIQRSYKLSRCRNSWA